MNLNKIRLQLNWKTHLQSTDAPSTASAKTTTAPRRTAIEIERDIIFEYYEILKESFVEFSSGYRPCPSGVEDRTDPFASLSVAF